MVELFMQVDPRIYSNYLIYESGKVVLYYDPSKALYETIRYSRIFWDNFTKILKCWLFVVNPHNACVTKNTFNYAQFTILW